jgi:pilus assembly protein CpaF
VAQKYEIEELFVRQYRGFDDKQRVLSDLVPTGVLPKCLPQLEEHGVTLPDAVIERAKHGKQRAS